MSDYSIFKTCSDLELSDFFFNFKFTFYFSKIVRKAAK